MSILGIFAMVKAGKQHAQNKKDAIVPVVYQNFNKDNFDKTVHFTCEFCGEKIDNSRLTCPNCDGEYNKNPDYIAQKREVYTKYLEYLKQAEANINKERENISATIKLQQKSLFMKRNFYNFDLETLEKNKPVYNKKDKYEFSCDSCGAKIVGHTHDGKVCPYCGAEYDNDIELLTLEQEEATDKALYEEYQTLRKFMEETNNENDEYVRKQNEKYMKLSEKSDDIANAVERIAVVGKAILTVVLLAFMVFIFSQII